MKSNSISRAQLKRLQTCWGQYCRHEIVQNTREARLQWARQHLPLRESLFSFKDLTIREAADLINILQSQLGIAETRPPKRQRRRLTQDEAQAAGTEGRRAAKQKTLTFATPESLALLDDQLTAMGWDRTRLDAFLRSPSSPLGAKRQSNPTLRTVGDVNRVYWALKRIAGHKPKEVNA